MKKYAAILLLLLGAMPAVHAQTMPEVEQQIKEYLSGISYWRFEYNAEDTSFGYEVNPEDSVRTINEKLYNYITGILTKVPGIMKRPPALGENPDVTIVSSGDKKISIYNWDTHIGKAEEFFANVIMYDGNGATPGIYDAEMGLSYSGEYVEIMEVQGKNKKYYLPVMKWKVDDKDVRKTVWAFSIVNGNLQAEELFENKGNKTNNIEYSYNYMSNYDFDKMKEVHNVHLGRNGKKLYIPQVENGQLTGEWQVYEFDGNKFVYDKTEN